MCCIYIENKEVRIIAKKFYNDWKVEKGKFKVKFIFKIDNPNLKEAWEKYKLALCNEEVVQVYHGTTCCEEITTEEGQFCQNKECGICGIAQNGMNLSSIGKRHPEEKRFGQGFYFAPHSSKSDDYTSKNRLGYRAMLVCDVVLGKKLTVKDGDDESIHSKLYSGGFDSIVVEPNDYNTEEVVIFSSPAVLPRYIIVYEKIEAE